MSGLSSKPHATHHNRSDDAVMKLSRTRLILSGVLGLWLAIVALTMATLLDHQGDPALAQSTDLRQQFVPPTGATNPVDALRTPTTPPPAQEVQLAAPAPATSAPVAQPAVTADETPVAVASLDAVAANEHGAGVDGAREAAGEREGGDD